MAPFIHDTVMTKLRASATAAALQCSGGDNGRWCGLRWQDGAKWDGSQGVGEQMAALEVIQSTLIQQVAAPLTNTTGGTSKGDYSAGGDTSDNPIVITPATKADRVGAGFLTFFTLTSFLGMAWFMVS
jgi:mannan endo-1,6-alpha-mannosidase